MALRKTAKWWHKQWRQTAHVSVLPASARVLLEVTGGHSITAHISRVVVAVTGSQYHGQYQPSGTDSYRGHSITANISSGTGSYRGDPGSGEQNSSHWGRQRSLAFEPLSGWHDLKQNEAHSARAQSTHKGVKQRSKDATQRQQQRPQSLTVTFTWHAGKYEVHKLHERYIFSPGMQVNTRCI